MTTATLTDAATVTLAFPLAAVEGLRHAITLAIHERPSSERDMLASIYGALVNPQPAPVRAACAPVDVLAVMDAAAMGAYQRGSMTGDRHYPGVREYEQARAAIAELIEAASMVYRLHLNCETNRYAITNAYSDLSAALTRVGSAGGGK